MAQKAGGNQGKLTPTVKSASQLQRGAPIAKPNELKNVLEIQAKKRAGQTLTEGEKNILREHEKKEQANNPTLPQGQNIGDRLIARRRGQAATVNAPDQKAEPKPPGK